MEGPHLTVMLTHHDITVPNARKTLLRSSFIHEDDRAIVLKGLSGITPKHPRCRMEIRLMTSGGGYEWFDVYANALWDADSGSRLGYLGKLPNINVGGNRRIPIR